MLIAAISFLNNVTKTIIVQVILTLLLLIFSLKQNICQVHDSSTYFDKQDNRRWKLHAKS